MKLVLILSLAGCALTSEATTPDYPHFRGAAIRVVPPRPEWLAGYAGAEICSGRRGDVRRVRWHIVPGPAFTVDGMAAIGYTDGDDIYLSEPAAERIWVARHEALHHLGFRHYVTTDTANTRRSNATFIGKCKATWPDPADLL